LKTRRMKEDEETEGTKKEEKERNRREEGVRDMESATVILGDCR